MVLINLLIDFYLFMPNLSLSVINVVLFMISLNSSDLLIVMRISLTFFADMVGLITNDIRILLLFVDVQCVQSQLHCTLTNVFSWGSSECNSSVL